MFLSGLSFVQKLPLSQQCDATFITTTDEKEKETLSPRGTYVIPKGGNATFNVEQTTAGSNRGINDQTVVVSKKTAAGSKVSGSSIMTEDDSDSDCGARKRAPSALKNKKDPKELFK